LLNKQEQKFKSYEVEDEDKVTMWKTEEECLPAVKLAGGGIVGLIYY
jgi:uncharacterized protein YcsI (UPF0317 family)